MKKQILTIIITALFLTLLTSCEGDDFTSTPKSYRIINNFEEQYTPSDPYLDGSLYEVIVFQLNSREEVIREDYIPVIRAGGYASQVIRVANTCESIQVSFLDLPTNQGGILNHRYYTVQYFRLPKDRISDVVIDSDTPITTNVSMAHSQGDTTVSHSINLAPSL